MAQEWVDARHSRASLGREPSWTDPCVHVVAWIIGNEKGEGAGTPIRYVLSLVTVEARPGFNPGPLCILGA